MPLVHVFDLGNVLVGYDEDRCLRRLRAACREGAPVEEVLRHHLDSIRPEIGGDFDALHPLLVRDLGLTMTPEELRLAWNDIFESVPGMLEVVRKSPRPRYMLSSTNEPHVAWLRQHFGWVFDLFDHCFLSNEIGLTKPDIALFRHVESVTGQAPERHLLIDDLLQNVDAARAAGWHAVRFLGVEDCQRRLAQAAAQDAMESTSK